MSETRNDATTDATASQAPISHYDKLVAIVSTELFFSPVARSLITRTYLYYLCLIIFHSRHGPTCVVRRKPLLSPFPLFGFPFYECPSCSPLIVVFTVQCSNDMVLERLNHLLFSKPPRILSPRLAHPPPYALPRLTICSILPRSPSASTSNFTSLPAP